MTKLTDDQQANICKYLDLCFTERIVFVNPEIIKEKTMIYGRQFIPIKGITGLVAFGSGYPFSHRDISIADLFRLIDFSKSITTYGLVIDKDSNQHILYQDTDNIQYWIKEDGLIPIKISNL